MVSKRKSLVTLSDIPPDIAGLCQQIGQWRQTRRHREPMPKELWSLAASLARRYGVARLARVGRLDYYSLREQGGRMRIHITGAAASDLAALSRSFWNVES
jgi:hypothetical protein